MCDFYGLLLIANSFWYSSLWNRWACDIKTVSDISHWLSIVSMSTNVQITHMHEHTAVKS